MNEREKIIGVLRNLAWRLWIARFIHEMAFAAGVVLFGLICLQLADPGLQGQAQWGSVLLVSALLSVLIAIAADALIHCARRVSLKTAAAYADVQAQLKDELKSASWFLSANRLSPFEDLQVRRAATTAAALDLTALAPSRWQGHVLPVAGLGILLAALPWMQPELSYTREFPQQSRLEEHREVPGLRSLLKNAPPRAEIAQLDSALSTLQRPGTSLEDRQRALAEAREAIEMANMEASAAREDLAQLSQSLKADARFERVSRAMEKGRVDEAMALLRVLKSDAEDALMTEQGTEAMAKADVPEGGPLAAAEPAASEISGKTAALNQDALNRVIEALQQANERMDVQTRVNNVRRRMEDSLIATTQREQLTASHFDSAIDAANPTPSSQTGNADIRGGTLFRQAAVAREDDDRARDGSQTGDASGESRALPLEGAVARRLDAQLQLETILQQNEWTDEPNGKGDAGWFYAASREQKSSLQAEQVQSDVSRQREAALQHNRVPLRQKDLVKNYFLNLHESEKK
jgi:hypothetical protein